MLTYRQNQVLQFIVEFQAAYGGLSPSFQQIADGCGIKSKAGVHHAMQRLKERGFVRHIPGRDRCIEVLRLPLDRASILALFTTGQLEAELERRRRAA